MAGDTAMADVDYAITVAGDAAVNVVFGDAIAPEAGARVRAAAAVLAENPVPGVVETVPTFCSLMVCYDPSVLGFDDLVEKLADRLRRLEARPESPRRVVRVPVCYGGAFGPDLQTVADHAGLTPDEVVRIHSGRDYLIDMLGFLPGFAYVGGLDARLHTPRLAVPRTVVPAGSVGIGGAQTGVYPLASPGGWQLIGRTPLRPYDPARAEPFLYQAGDYLRFEPISAQEYAELEKAELEKDAREKRARAGRAARSGEAGTLQGAGGDVRVVAPGMCTTVQDAGRPGYLASGFAPGGAADARAYALANLLVENPAGAAVLEFCTLGPTLRFACDAVVALTGGDFGATLDGRPQRTYEAFAVRRGQELALGPARTGVFGYLAFAGGGLRVDCVMGSCSTNLRCGIGGLGGRALLRGDRLDLQTPGVDDLVNLGSHRIDGEGAWYGFGDGGGSGGAGGPSGFGGPDVDLVLRAVPGPQEGRFSGAGIAAFYGEAYRVTSKSDRMGYRLEGPRVQTVAGSDVVSDGIAPGAVQVPDHGMPIVMLADRQTTGGYAKIATVASVDVPRLVQCRPGRRVRFEPIDVRRAQELYRAELDRRTLWEKTVRRGGDVPSAGGTVCPAGTGGLLAFSGGPAPRRTARRLEELFARTAPVPGEEGACSKRS